MIKAGVLQINQITRMNQFYDKDKQKQKQSI